MNLLHPAPVALFLAALNPAPAQCAITFASGGGVPNAVGVTHLVARANGHVAAAAQIGTFQNLTWQIRDWDGTSWTTLGGTINGIVEELVELPSGDLVIGGYFTAIGNVTAFGLARWDGTSWHSFGTGTNGYVEALTVKPDGKLVAAGNFTIVDGTPVVRIAEFDGTTWTSLGNAARHPGIRSVTALPDGRIAAAGNFLTGGSAQDQIALWDGAAWSLLTLVVGGGESVTALATGELAIVNSYGHLILWDGNAFSYAPNNYGWTKAVGSLPNGDLVTVGRHLTGNNASRVLRWNGTQLTHTSWTAIAHVDQEINALAMTNSGHLVLGGYFHSPQPFTAFLATTCPAAATATGTGCVGSGGLNTLSATNLPWTGSTFRARADGLSNHALALSLFGLSATSLPQPLGQPGCMLLASPDAVQLLLPTNGAATTHLQIPNTAAFAGLVLHHQVLAAELSAQNAFLAATSTNALQLTIGTF